jgi:hypothetical protein
LQVNRHPLEAWGNASGAARLMAAIQCSPREIQMEAAVEMSHSYTEQPQLIGTMKQDMPAQVSLDLPSDLFPGRVVTEVPSAQALLLGGADLEQGACLLPVMPAEAPEESRQPLEAKTYVVGAEDEIPIDCEAEALIERADAVPHPAAPKHGFLWDVIHPPDYVSIMVGQQATSGFPAVGVDEDPMPIDDVDVGVSLKRARDERESSRQQYVVGVEIAHDVSVGRLGESAIDSIGLAAIGFAAHN